VQARYLRANGCMTMQGYLYHRPMPLPRFIDVLRQSQGHTRHHAPAWAMSIPNRLIAIQA
jgi:sensor c-di-GMP phosphodiesterase-like protein